MTKDTSELIEELKLCPDFGKFYDKNREQFITVPLSEMLVKLAEDKGVSRGEAIRRSTLSETYGYQIFSGLRIPERNKLLALAIGIGVNLEQVQTLLQCAGYPPLYVKIPFDSVVIYGICNGLTVVQINDLLFQYGLETLR